MDVPKLERPQLREAPHRLTVRARDRQVDRFPLLDVEAAIASSHLEARDQSFDVPLERARERLVEVIDAECKPAVGAGERAEVRKVSIAAVRRVEASARFPGEVRGHHTRRTSEKRERRDEHPAIADRDQLRHPRAGLLLEQLDRVRPVGCRLPLAMPRSPHFPRAALPSAARSAALGCRGLGPTAPPAGRAGN